MKSALHWFNLTLRALMEVSIIVAFGYWGYKTGDSAAERILLGIGTPLLGFGFWGLIDFRRTGLLAEPLRLIQELVISVIAALAWHTAGAPRWGLALAMLSLAHHALIYALGERLLKNSVQPS